MTAHCTSKQKRYTYDSDYNIMMSADHPDLQKEMVTLVASLADRKREDLDSLRTYLLEHHQKELVDHAGGKKKKVVAVARQKLSMPALSISQNKIQKKPAVVPTPKNGSAGLRLVRCIVLDLPLMLLFASLACVYFTRCVWNDYYVPIATRARRTDDDLLDEYTYYERTCTAQDVTKQSFTKSNANTTTQQALEHMLTHGAVILPELLTAETIQQLRRFVVNKNNAITSEEAYPVSQGYRRLSYGIEATEDPAVMQALEEITSSSLLPKLLEEILGVPDPALTELTAITSYYGCKDQVVHSDTKSDGYAAQYARTYSHSYSLFIPLQPITTAMGVTQVCPGTHFCTNDMEEVCLQEQIGVNQAYEDRIWKAGDGAMINQQVWHGGTAVSKRPNSFLFLYLAFRIF
jgi:hypothetical protein